MSKRSIIIYWLLLLVATLIVGAALFQLLRHEHERIIQQFRLSATDRLQIIAENVRLAVVTVEENVTEALLQIDDSARVETLNQWKDTNPLVRNVFVWMDTRNLLIPHPGQFPTAEESRFIARYNALFSGRVPWQMPEADRGDRKTPFQTLRRESIGPLGLRKLAQTDISQSVPASLEGSGSYWPQSGWIPWFWENRLCLLGWVRKTSHSSVYGVEIEMMALLSRLVTNLPQEVPEGLVYGLMNGNAQLIHQVGSESLEEEMEPDITVSLAPQLPHWQVAAYFVDGSSTARSSKAFIILTALLLAIFLAAIVFGGSMLLWQAHRNMLDAMQKTSFVSNVSHELKTPLTNIRMYAELLKSDRIKDLKKRSKYLGVIVSESERLTRLVNNVLDFSRLEQGRKRYRLERLDIAQCVRNVVETQRLRFRDGNIRLDLKIPQEPVFMDMDRDALEQVLLNLLDNAIKYGCGRDTGGGISGGEVTVMLQPHPEHVELSIIDRGPGVTPGHEERIFDKFHRVDDSLTAPQPGSGLGLTISRRLLRDLGGDLIYKTREGGGSCFTVKLTPSGRGESVNRCRNERFTDSASLQKDGNSCTK